MNLQNQFFRLQLIYERMDLLSTTRTEHTFDVTITIPQINHEG